MDADTSSALGEVLGGLVSIAGAIVEILGLV